MSDLPKCPACGESHPDYIGRWREQYDCAVCGKTWTVRPLPVTDSPKYRPTEKVDAPAERA